MEVRTKGGMERVSACPPAREGRKEREGAREGGRAGEMYHRKHAYIPEAHSPRTLAAIAAAAAAAAAAADTDADAGSGG
eukprot:evm.model.NODE_25240_length_35198_cov_29.221746.1